jgi:hypothetical protein
VIGEILRRLWHRLGIRSNGFVTQIGLRIPDRPLSRGLNGSDKLVSLSATKLIPPGALPRRLVLGQDVVFNERITTEAEGQTQILFVDESTLSVGAPTRTMVVDQFVYDPNAGTGKVRGQLDSRRVSLRRRQTQQTGKCRNDAHADGDDRHSRRGDAD